MIARIGVFFLIIFSNVVAYATELPKDFVYLSNVAPSIEQDIRYDSYHNFVGRPIKGYDAPTCILTKQAATALKKVQKALVKRQLSLKVYDCYRPQMAVSDFLAWSKTPNENKMAKEFYPRIAKNKLFPFGYIAARSGHSRGSTVDLTIVPLPTAKQASYQPGQRLIACFAPVGKRFHDNSIDMGTGYDCLDPLAAPLSHGVSKQAQKNRLLLRKLMMRYGFKPYSKEWWHFTLRNEPFPKTYFNFKVI